MKDIHPQGKLADERVLECPPVITAPPSSSGWDKTNKRSTKNFKKGNRKSYNALLFYIHHEQKDNHRRYRDSRLEPATKREIRERNKSRLVYKPRKRCPIGPRYNLDKCE